MYRIMPESPRWLISKGRYKEASKIVEKIAKVNKVQLPDDVIGEDTVENQRSYSVMKMFTVPKLLLRTLIIYFNWYIYFTPVLRRNILMGTCIYLTPVLRRSL